MKNILKISCCIIFFLSCKTEKTEILSKHENGQIKEQIIIGLDSLPDGYVLKQIFHNDGKLKCQGNKYDDERQGKWSCYYKNGELEWSSTYKYGKGHGMTECYYENGTWKKTTLKEGVLEGSAIEFNYDSIANEFYYVQGEYKNGLENGSWISKYEDQSRKSTTNYVEGIKEGEFKQYHKNGLISVRGKLENNKLQDSIFIFNDKSELVRIELFENVKMIKEVKMR